MEVVDEEGVAPTYRIVGPDEIDLGKGHISYKSPLGRALLKKEEGDVVRFHAERRSGARDRLRALRNHLNAN